MWLFRPPTERFFDLEERRQVEALFEAIFPGSETSPGARDVVAVEYLDRLLAMDETTYYEIPAWRDLYREALPDLDRAVRAAYGNRGVAELVSDEVTQLLTDLADGRLEGMDPSAQRRLFSTLRNHCIEGCFSDPRWGGNRGALMWSWYGYLQSSAPFQRFGGPGKPLEMLE